ncbi:MAG: chemotaxis protein histidine kinase CheA [Gammaproteobacteria bacterium]
MTIESAPTLIQHIEELSVLATSFQKNNSRATLDPVAEKLEETGLNAGEQNMPGFQDVCFLLQDFLLETPDSSVYKATQQQQLINWIALAKDYVSHPDDNSAENILKIFKVDCWPAPLTETDTNFMKEMLVAFDDSTNDTANEKINEPEIAGEISTSDLKSEDVLAELRQALNDYRSNANPMLDNIIKQFDRIGTIASNSDLPGFEDICLLLQQNLEDLEDDNKKLSDDQYLALEQWLDDADHYINTPTNNTAILSMINALVDHHWPSSLAESDTAVLKEMFGIVDELSNEAFEPKSLAVDSATNKLTEEVNVTAEPCPISPMLIDMLLEEIKRIEKDIEDALEKRISEAVDEKLRHDALSQLAVRFERFGNACQAAELAGLYQATDIIQKNILLIEQNDAIASQNQSDLIKSWPKAVKEYLSLLGDDGSGESIVNILSSENWAEPLIAEVAPALIDLLNAPYASEEEAREIRQTEALAEDVSLELPTDISRDLLDGLLQELPSQTEGFSNAIQALIYGSGGSKEIEKAQRIAHTVKGAANTVGIRGIATLTHQLEDIFQFLNQHNKLPSKLLASSLVNASDCLEEMSESLITQGSAPENALEILQDIFNWINRLENEGVGILDDYYSDGSGDDPGSVAEDSASKQDTDVKPDATEDDQGPAIATLRVEAPIIDDLIRLLGETIILTTQLQEKIKISSIETDALIKQNQASHELINQLEQQIELRGTSRVSQAINQNEVFDSLELEEYNELHTITNQLAETTLDSVELNKEIKRELHELDELVIGQSRLHREVQRLVMRTRMVPIKTITPRLQRSVRQTCRTVGKQAALYLSGTDTLIDSDILNDLVDPLIHMLRNSLDHGIEDRDKRINKNKDPEGRIDLSFSSEGTEIIVRCQDDGAGLDHDSIRATAIKRNLIEPHEKPTPLELDRMILKPGFSTSKKTTEVSGRGIGMDLVYSQILANKGTLHIESEKDKGCLIELRMPVTLISTHVLIIRHRNKMLAVSSRGVEQILHPSDSQIVDSENGLMCKIGDELLELSNLENLIDFPGDRRMSERVTRPALLVRDEDINKVVYVQELIDSRELVIKSMGKYMSNIRGVSGATILGDGSVVPVLDIPELLRTSTQSEERTSDDDFEQAEVSIALPTALVVDDSLSARRALAQVVRDAGYDVRTAKDGLEAIDIIDKKIPDILLVDMEMPRMNGMELTAHVRANPKTANIPVIMVTSRSTEKHREQAKSSGVNIHLTKPFSEDELLDHISKLLN